MNWQDVAGALFPQGHSIIESDHFLSGEAQVAGQTVAIIGTTGHTPTGAAGIYANKSLLNDVTSGSNGSCGGTYLCTAGANYDGPTGNGTPNGPGAF